MVNCVMIPLDVAFEEYGNDTLTVLEYLIDVFFCADIAITFRTTYFYHDGELIVEWNLIAHNYVHGWFSFDLIATWPWELMAPGASTQILGILKLPRILRLSRLMKNLEVLRAANLVRSARPYCCDSLPTVAWCCPTLPTAACRYKCASSGQSSTSS